MRQPCRPGIPWSSMIPCDRMTTTNTRSGAPRNALTGVNVLQSSAEWKSASDRDGVRVILTLKLLDQTTKTARGNQASARTRNLSFFQLFFSFLGRFDTIDRWSRADDAGRSRDVPMADAPPVVVDKTLTGDEAFQRRLAMSQRPRSPAPAPSPLPPPSRYLEDEVKPHVATPTETGDEAYLRRLAISTMNRAQAGFPAVQLTPTYMPPPPQPERPRSISPPTLAYNPFTPPSVPPPPPGPPATITNALEERVKAAAAIAAKLSAMGAAGAASSSSSSSQSQQPAHAVEETRYTSSLIFLGYYLVVNRMLKA